MSADPFIASFNPIHYPWWQDPLGQGTDPKGAIPIPGCLPPLTNKNGLAKELPRIKWTECYPCPPTLAQTFAYSLSQSLAWQKNTEMCTYTYYIYSCFLAPAIIKRGDLSFYEINRLAVSAHSHVRERHWLEWSVSNPMKKKYRASTNNWNWIQWLIWSRARAEQSAPNPVPSPWSSQPIGFVLDGKECDLYLSEPRNFAGPSRARGR
jgi:hypothetical protein